MTVLHTLAAFLVLNGVEPSAATTDCLPDDNGCKAKRSELRAASAQTPEQRATYLRSAHRSYLFLFDKTGEAADLCSARRTFDASLAVKDQSAEERARTQVLLNDLLARERKAGAACKGLAKQRRVSKPDMPPVVARAVEPPTRTADPIDEPPPLLTSTTTREPPPRPEPSPPASASPPPSHQPSDVALMPIPHQRVPRRHTDGPRPGRGLVAAGAVTLGVGVALTAVAGALGRRASETKHQYFALHDTLAGFATPEQDATATGLFRDYNATRAQALALAFTGGTTIVLAAVLAGVGGRRMARAASRTALVPVPGGLALYARF